MVTQEQIKSATTVILEVTRAIHDLGEVPAGHLYATMMGAGIDLPAFNRIVGIICKTGLVEKRGDLLRWVGGA